MAKHHGLENKAVHFIEQSRVEAVSKSLFAEHIARVQAACDPFALKREILSLI